MEIKPSTNILTDPQWNKTLEENIPINLPILVRPDGDMFVLESHSNLLDFKIRHNDLYLVNPHGEIVPFVALAIRQRLFQAIKNPSIFHIDMHEDNMNKRYHREFREDIPAERVSASITRFVNSNGDFQKRFKDIIELTADDISTFLKALNEYFPNIGASIRKSGSCVTLNQHPSPNYFDKILTQKMLNSLPRIIKQNQISVYSIDADYAGCTEEDDYMEIFRFASMMEYLIESLQAEIENEKAGKKHPTLYTVSLDPAFCTEPKEFIKTFIQEFYIPLIRVRTSGKSRQILQSEA